MPTDPINGLSSIMQALRRRMAERGEKTSAQASTRSARTRQTQGTHQGGIDELQKKIAGRLAQLAPDERGSSQAARIFVESALAWEFGDDILTDPAFEKLSTDIQNLIRQAPETRRRFEALLKSL